MQATLAVLLLISSASAGVVELKANPEARLLAAVEVVEFPNTAAHQLTAAQSQLLSAGNSGSALIQQTVSTHARTQARPCDIAEPRPFPVHSVNRMLYPPVCLLYRSNEVRRSRDREQHYCNALRRMHGCVQHLWLQHAVNDRRTECGKPSLMHKALIFCGIMADYVSSVLNDGNEAV